MSEQLHSITNFQVYVSTSDFDKEEIEVFYEQPNSIIAKPPMQEFIIVGIDLNSAVGLYAYQY